MCELFGLNSKYPSRVRLSLASFADQAGNRNQDGWGLANMEGNDAYVYREPVSAKKSNLAQFLAQEGVFGSIVLSHVRKRTIGKLCLANTHPFCREWQGRIHLFAFNGDVPDVFQITDKPKRFQPLGDTDAEWAFCILLERLHGAATEDHSVAMDIIYDFGNELSQLGPANFLYASGERLYAFSSRRRYSDGEKPPGLHLFSRRCKVPATNIIAQGVHVESGSEISQQVTLIASIPITTETWRPFSEKELVCLSHGQLIDHRKTSNTSDSHGKD